MKIKQAMAKPKSTKPRKPGSGGARSNTGPKTNAEKGHPRAKQYIVSLYPSEQRYLIATHGSLTTAIRTLLPESERVVIPKKEKPA